PCFLLCVLCALCGETVFFWAHSFKPGIAAILSRKRGWRVFVYAQRENAQTNTQAHDLLIAICVLSR
ncbi:MAG: hypothetical protein JXB30_10530, partial [Anaerolineae bacterium]|nr:hypothetical protein [Anaerolineae bacterium]